MSSKRNSDFKSGGFYGVNEKDQKIDLEKYIDVGDMSLFCPSIEHGVYPIDENSMEKIRLVFRGWKMVDGFIYQ